MSSITPSPIASSVAQGVLQQSQASKSSDAQRNEAARHSQRMRELLQKHIESVEDSYETTDDQMQVKEHREGGDSGKGAWAEQLEEHGRSPLKGDAEEAEEVAAEDDAEAGVDEAGRGGRLDITA